MSSNPSPPPSNSRSSPPVYYPFGCHSSVSPSSSSSAPFSLVSYNLLAQQYYRAEEFQYHPHTASERVELFKSQFASLDADIFAFQEVEMDRFDRIIAEQIKRQNEEKEMKNAMKQQQQQRLSKTDCPATAVAEAATETPFEPNVDDLGTFLRQRGYDLCLQIHSNRAKGHTVCVAFAWKKDKFQLFWNDPRSRALCIGLQFIQPLTSSSSSSSHPLSDCLYLANVHLQGHPSQSQERFNQIASLIKQIKKQMLKDAELRMKWKPQSSEQEDYLYNQANFILTGDFNCGNRSLVYSALKSPKHYMSLNSNNSPNKSKSNSNSNVNSNANSAESTPMVHIDGESGIEISTREFQSPFALVEAYEHAEAAATASAAEDRTPADRRSSRDAQGVPHAFTYARPNGGWLIDFLFYSPDSLHCCGVQQIFESDSQRHQMYQTGLPDLHHPSDHLPIGGVFYRK